ncbi:MAG: hypothetical protein R6V03_06130 [Kiritimatiellia bacterium]
MDPIIHAFVEEAGNTTQSIGLGRVVGQIYAYLYFSREPRNLADMQEALGISKGSASTGVRQLEQWGGARKVWVKGDRKDYYAADDWFGQIVKSAVTELVGRKMASYGSLLDEVEGRLAALEGSGDGKGEFVRERVKNLRRFQKRAEQVWASPLVQHFLK